MTNVRRMLTSTLAVALDRTSKAADSAGRKPARVAVMTYRPGGTSGNVTLPVGSVVVLASATL